MDKDLIGLEVSEAVSLLEQDDEVNFKFISYKDKKQLYADSERVCAVQKDEHGLVLVVCPFLFNPIG